MSTLIKIIITSILGLSLFSCNFNSNMGIKGNGDVITKERSLEGSFNQIEVSRGLDIYLTQSNDEQLSVQADENLHDIIITKVEDNILKIYPAENIYYSAVQKVMVNFKNVAKISSEAGSDVYGTTIIRAESLDLKSASGGDIELEVEVRTLYCEASSGSDIKVKGTADTLIASAASGSDIQAKNLVTLVTNAKAISGADIKVNVLKELTANAQSGSDITYVGNPEKINRSEGVSASIKQE